MKYEWLEHFKPINFTDILEKKTVAEIEIIGNEIPSMVMKAKKKKRIGSLESFFCFRAKKKDPN